MRQTPPVCTEIVVDVSHPGQKKNVRTQRLSPADAAGSGSPPYCPRSDIWAWASAGYTKPIAITTIQAAKQSLARFIVPPGVPSARSKRAKLIHHRHMLFPPGWASRNGYSQPLTFSRCCRPFGSSSGAHQGG